MIILFLLNKYFNNPSTVWYLAAVEMLILDAPLCAYILYTLAIK